MNLGESKMGNLTPGATYIYERVDNVVYAREVGTNKRTVAGWDYKDGRNKYSTNQLNWVDVFEKANTHPGLQKALDNVILIYNMIKEEK